MRYNKAKWIVLSGIYLLAATGCAESAKSAAAAPAKFFGKAFKPIANGARNVVASASTPAPTNASGASVDNRFNTDSHGSNTTHHSTTSNTTQYANITDNTPTQRNSRSTSAKSLPVTEEEAYYSSVIEKEYEQVAEQERAISEKSEAIRKQIAELEGQLGNLDIEHKDKQSKLNRIQQLKSYLEKEDALALKENKTSFEGSRFGQQRPNDYSACVGPKGAYAPPVENDFTANAAPANTFNGVNTSKPVQKTAAEITPGAISTTIIDKVESDIGIGVGTRNGVKEGMCFKGVDKNGQVAVYIVKKAYETFSSAYPHPKFNKGQLGIADTLTLVNPSELK